MQEAKVLQNRISFHTTPIISTDLSQPVTDFLSWVGTLIPKDKFKIFSELFRYPVKTNEITGVCYDKLSRIFDGRNPSFDYQFMSTESKDDWEWYRQDILKEPTIWQTQGFERMKTDINSVLIVDMPAEAEQGDNRARPYFYWLPLQYVRDYRINKNTGNMEYIVFEQGDMLAVFDDAYYRIFTKAKDGNVGELISEKQHTLNYCPARFFWSDAVSLAKPDIKESPITKQLEALDWFLFFSISKKHLDLYGSYPIYSGYEPDCKYSNDETHEYCDHGFLRNDKGVYRTDAVGMLLKCPMCGDKRIAGAGSFIEVPVPKDGQPDLSNPVQMLSADVASLEFNVNEETRLKNNIITSVVGVDSEIVSSQALNEKQVDANFESQSAILNRIKKNFEQAQKFVDETICRLRYGSEFVSANINYGTEFYTLNAEALRERYKTAKEAGASESELDALQTQIIETEYRTNPTMRQRMLILAELEPMRHLTIAEAKDLYKDGLIDWETMQIKLHFTDFVRRFERENTNVLEFGTEVPFYIKVQNIYNKFKEYGSTINRRQD